MSSSSRSISREESKLITRRRLLKTAAQLLVDNEPAAITMSDLTTGAGITQPAFYRHFSSKEDCLREALENEINSLREAIGISRKNLANQQSSYQSLEELIRLSYEALAGTGKGFKFVMRELRNPNLSSGLYTVNLRDLIINDVVSDAPDIAKALGVKYDKDYFLMVTDGLVGLGEALVIGYIDGKYNDMEALVKITMQYLEATIPDLIEAFNKTAVSE